MLRNSQYLWSIKRAISLRSSISVRFMNVMGKPKPMAQGLQQLRTDLAGGETDTIEFKPFMEPKSTTESDFVRTVIAFANTHGGRIYVGVDDDGLPQGEAEACRVFRG